MLVRRSTSDTVALGKKIRYKSEGNSEFTRSKLEEQYNPRPSIFRRKALNKFCSEILKSNKLQQLEKERVQDQFVQIIRKGSSVSIDLNTKVTFKTRKINTTLPEIKQATFRPEITHIQDFLGEIPFRGARKNWRKDEHVLEKAYQLQHLLQTNNYKARRLRRKVVNPQEIFHATKSQSIRAPAEFKITRMVTDLSNPSKFKHFKEQLDSKFSKIRQEMKDVRIF